ncbi:uncharacterized protein LOC110706185 [Chenopodium quinoa]|uniref:uncharacterized protein LOC110706185 n=1 Tax=Chenopodium quinoa TaxID=63459 RepID=UPI000B777F34|nr:uncharacterized protein LOC110706185 [Chenopodium quinoa]
MIVTVWNVRGLNDPWKVADVRQLLNKTKTDVICLLETKVKKQNCVSLQKKIGFTLTWVCNYIASGKGRIWLGWKSDRLHIDVLTIHAQLMHCCVSSLDYSKQVSLSFLYGLYCIHDRKSLWEGIKEIGSISMPWFCTGDFNSVLNYEDRMNGTDVPDYVIRDFRDFIDYMQFAATKSKGPYFLWSNKAHTGPRTLTRIDRGLVNFEWLSWYPNVEAHYLAPSLSYHSPLLYEVLPTPPGKGRPFRFLNCLNSHPDFNGIVQEVWNKGFRGTPMYRVWSKLKYLKVHLKGLNRSSFSNVDQRLSECQVTSLDIQNQLAHNPNCNDMLDQETGAIDKLKYWRVVQESIYKQKSRIDWVALGDSNSKFFFL